MTSGVGATLTYDSSNRMLSAAEVSGGTEYYGYSPDNKRMYRLTASGTEEWTFYGGYGEKLGVFNYSTSAGLFPVRSNVYFAGRTIIDDNFPVFQDRVGTNRASGARFMPFGDEITSTSNDREKFATYTRDSYTGLDYADQRFYASTYGRFNTPDPANRGALLRRPQSWDMYAYTRGDPVNLYDPNGECTPMRDCIGRGIQAVGGVIQVVGGAVIIVAAGAAEIETGGAATALGAGVALVGGIGQIFSGGLNIGAAFSGNNALGSAATAVNNVTNPAGLVTSVATGSATGAASTLASLAYDSVTSITALGSAVINGLPSNTSDAAALGVASAPFFAVSSGVLTAATTALIAPSPLQIYTAPVQVVADPEPVPYAPSTVTPASSLTYSVGGGSSEAAGAEEDEDN
jgi:RHS repeat-associated protein